LSSRISETFFRPEKSAIATWNLEPIVQRVHG